MSYTLENTTMERKQYVIRNLDAGDLLENFLVSAVTSLLGIRFYLYLTDYPQISTGILHIAHMLWGGLFMFIALLLMLTFLNKPIQRLSAIIGGFGFGLFIDELGKFITSDHNYFFEPTILILYVIFILLFLLFRKLERQQTLSKKEYLMNALEMMEEAVLGDMSTEDKKITMSLLRKSDPNDPVVIGLKRLLKDVETVPEPKPSWFAKLRHTPRLYYQKLIQSNWFANVVVWFFVGKSIFSLFSMQRVYTYVSTHLDKLSPQRIHDLSFSQSGELLFSTFSSLFVILGVILIRKSRLQAYLMFKRSVLITIFFTQFFIFYREQLSAIVGLLFNVFILFTLQYMISEEELPEKVKDEESKS